MQHRIFLAPLRPCMPHAEAHGHWCSNHAALMLKLPYLKGYVQNRPLPEWWPHLGYLACSETWFADRQTEREAYASPWYTEEIARDEQRMFARDHAWSAAVTDVQELHAGSRAGLRVLAFGGDPESLSGSLIEGELEVLRLSRDVPGLRRSLLVSAYCEDPVKARGMAARLGGLSFVADPVIVVEGPAQSGEGRARRRGS